jgi:hypothetical protein
MFLMWGYEGEGWDDIQATIDHVKVSDPDVFLTTVAYPIRGTSYFDEVGARAVGPQEWAESSDREFRIQGRHSRGYYQNVDRLLRAEVELHRSRGSPHGGNDAHSAELRIKIQQARDGIRATAAEVEA